MARAPPDAGVGDGGVTLNYATEVVLCLHMAVGTPLLGAKAVMQGVHVDYGCGMEKPAASSR